MGDRDSNQAPRRSPIVSVVIWLLIGIVVVGVVGGASFIYLAHRDSTFVDKAVGSLNDLASRLDGKEHSTAAGKVRELGKFLSEHDSDINNYGKDVDEKLNEIRKHSETAYQAAKKKVDEYMKKDDDGAEKDED
jgi:hypothetical protein